MTPLRPLEISISYEIGAFSIEFSVPTVLILRLGSSPVCSSLPNSSSGILFTLISKQILPPCHRKTGGFFGGPRARIRIT